MRLAFVVLTLAGGAGIVLYAGGLALPPDRRRSPRHASVARNDLVQVLALGAVTLGVLLLAQSLGLGFSDALLWPIVLAAMGTALIVGRSGRPIDELIGELVRRERGLAAPTTRADARRHVVGAARRRSAARWSSPESARSSPRRARSAPSARASSRWR